MKAFTSRTEQATPQKAQRLASSTFGADQRLHASDRVPGQQHSPESQPGPQQNISEDKNVASTSAETPRFRHNFADVTIHPKTALAQQSNEAASSGRSLGNYLSLRGPLASLAGTKVRPVTGLVDHHQALAQARNGGIEIDASMAGASAAEMQPLLAHEAIHVAQQKGAGHPGPKNLLEAEAFQLSRQVLAGQPVWPVLSGHSGMPLKQPPNKSNEPTEQELREIDEAWKKAMGPNKIKMDHLKAQLRYLQQLRTLIRDRQTIEGNRLVMDRNEGNLVQTAAELLILPQVNRKPLSIHIMPPMEEFHGELDFTVHFQARFLGRKKAEAQADFVKLQSNLQQGVQQIWGQTLGNMPALVRNYDFTFTATVVLVDEADARDDNFWLIDVNPATKRAETHAEINGGFMSIAPADINNADTLGHESLHLFGLTDRYRDNLRTKHSESVRGTGDLNGPGVPGKGTGVTRNDPLDTGKGPILAEDLDFVFAHSGVYDRVIMAQLDPYDVALFKQLGKGRIVQLPDLLDQSFNQAMNAPAPADPTKPQKLSEREKSSPQKIIVQKIDALIMQVQADIDQLALKSHMLDLPDMAPPQKTPPPAQKAP